MQPHRLLDKSRIPAVMNYAAAAGSGLPNPAKPRLAHQYRESPSPAKHADSRATRTDERRLRQDSITSQSDQKHTQHVTREEHKPKTGLDEETVYVLTLKLTDSLAGPINSMRDFYFPKRLNKIPAHLTLFHALPGSQLEMIERKLSALSAETKPFLVSSGKPFRMRLGVGINVGKGYNRMKQIHGDLRCHWMTHLSTQDQGGWKPHWTVMNKVEEEKKVADALERIEHDMLHNVREGEAVGLDLWRYDRGRWLFANEYTFKGKRDYMRTNATYF